MFRDRNFDLKTLFRGPSKPLIPSATTGLGHFCTSHLKHLNISSHLFIFGRTIYINPIPCLSVCTTMPSSSESTNQTIMVTSGSQQSHLLCNILNFHPSSIPIRRATPNTRKSRKSNKRWSPRLVTVRKPNKLKLKKCCFEKFRKNSITTVTPFNSK